MRLVRHLSDVEQEAVLKLREEEQLSAASALAGVAAPMPSRRRLDVCIRLKRCWGGVLGTWLQEQKLLHFSTKRLPWGTMPRFWKEQGGRRGGVDDRMLLRFARAWAAGTLASDKVAGDIQKRRRLNGGGRHKKAPGLRDLLFEWFCSVRGALAQRLPPAALAAKARTLREEYMKNALEFGQKVQVPQITPRWLRSWRIEHGVSLRNPNRRWKVSRAVLEERVRITWLNIIRVRRLCALAHGYDPVMEGWDQKPFHFNEAGSQVKKTLVFKGVGEVPLKELSSAVRARWSACTYSSTDPSRFVEFPPLEALFKGGATVEQRLDDMLLRLCAGGDLGDLSFFSAKVGPKGTYRTEHVVEFLRQHLEPASEGRDWRICLADFYGPHADGAVFDLCWSHQYVLILIGGGCTGVLQVMDTHLHEPLSKRYIELEMVDLLEQQRVRPHGCPTRSRESCCRDLIAAWRHAPMHDYAARGWFDNHLANALDGSQDHLGRMVARDLWVQMDMATLRAQALADVDAEWAAGRLRWQDAKRLIEPFPKRGEMDVILEGQDDEGDVGEVERGAVAWKDPAVLSEDEEETGDALASTQPRAPPSTAHLTLEQQQSIAEASAQLARLQEIRQKAQEFPNPRVLQQLDVIMAQVRRKTTGAWQQDCVVAGALRASALADDERLEAAKSAALAADRVAPKSKTSKGKRKEPEQATLAARAKKWLGKHVSLHLERGFDAADLGQGLENAGGEKHYKTRFELFLRVVRRFDNLDPTVENNLDHVFRTIDNHRRYERLPWKSKAYGSAFRNDMKGLLAALAAGDSSALSEWVRLWSDRAGVRADVVA